MVESYRLRWLTASAQPGKRVRLGIWRNGKAIEAVVVLLEKPGAPWEAPPPPPGLRRDQEPFGFAVEEPAREERDRPAGLRVASVDLRSCAYRAGVPRGRPDPRSRRPARPDKVAWTKALSSTARSRVCTCAAAEGALFFGLRRETPVASRRTAETPAGSSRDAPR